MYNLTVVDLSSYNTLRISAKASNLIEINTADDINKLPPENVFFLGSGANILFTKDFPGTIAKIKLSGIKVLKETNTDVLIEVAAGENWHDFVTWAVDHNLSGIENMALIPGTVGAAAIGNIAAYGGNQEDIFASLQATNIKTQKNQEFSKTDMQFGYRNSFLRQHPDYLVTSVTYRLSKTAHLNTSYHATRHASLLSTLNQINTPPFTIRHVFDAVVKIRSEKLPDPKLVGTAGSFFKNPVVSKEKFHQLKQQIPDLLAYPTEKLSYIDPEEQSEYVKVSIGRALDELGWRGKRIGNVGTFPQHALVIVTYPGATGQEVYQFAEMMRANVKKNFDINLEYEVVII
ncbi:UDP-N-acetylenolpyruvoylglucosamine reductase [Candidatus Amesbacteria bacterium RIFCSPLOWO2_02_FULL_48_11]|uniref:UDP-N-acetylenolpyruvoylglucosamine reductase n=3 Tax=Candidatus Amesiibacteriota TaxID=1752730 RepID=A0A1F4Z697_9BACT|nr:MAG: UDP-N-acetylenolpyruvoylglucosamine reductase [Candidatus Amesbacteria bacterium GW2011_GWC1_48_10]OGC89152.1 MAG: UDP-N-acetylenolpyruvoylglucosamine reductase [Candidatus Amesbacteria bacterium RBG_19FT_COMBO_48_16]OGC96633.1 MAG: UDP-N-acetylenolpyruvoylglucosamine reductase [Candidatus Amesbacteria bacterium RIFCSPHIGHO2_02_FULL_48_21]OGC99377.1 MAG: UDP-N-acetylenolpyruvoylglucosamine reductase [Candidatus Amesbacteria bacterium RBG_16_48_31]OGD00242.1 MAG: UDP-N-acetylenolpyruvoyl